MISGFGQNAFMPGTTIPPVAKPGQARARATVPAASTTAAA